MLMGLRPSGLRRAAGSSFSSAGGVPGNRARTRACWPVITVAVAWLTGRRRPQPVGLGVVVDQDGRAVFVAGQAVQRQAEDVFGTPPGVDGDLGGGLDLGWLQGVQAGAQHGHDLRWQVASGFAAHGLGGDVTDPEGEVAGQPGGGLPGAGQAERADPGQDGAGAPADDVAVVAADRRGRFKVAEAG